MRSYTVGFAESPREDEVVAGAATARHFGVEHLHVTLNAAAYRERLVPSAFHLTSQLPLPPWLPTAGPLRAGGEAPQGRSVRQGADEPLGAMPATSGATGCICTDARACRYPGLVAYLLPGLEQLQTSRRVFRSGTRLPDLSRPSLSHSG